MRRVIAVIVIVWIGLAGTTPVLHARLFEDFSIDRIDAHALVTPGSPEKLISVSCLLLGDPRPHRPGKDAGHLPMFHPQHRI